MIPTAESSEAVARELHALRKAGDIEAVAGPGKHMVYRLAGLASAQAPQEPPTPAPQPLAPLRQPARRAARARAAAEPAQPPAERCKAGRTPGTVPGAPGAQTLRDCAARLGISIGAMRAAAAAGVVPAAAVVRAANGMRVYGVVPSPEIDAALQAHAGERALRHGGNRRAATPAPESIPARVQIAAVILGGYSHFSHSASEDELLARAALRRADTLLRIATE